MGSNPEFGSQGTYQPDQLISGEFPRVTKTVTVAQGQVLVAGSVLGKITEGGEYKLSASAAGDGSQAPAVILVEAVDTTAGELDALVYLTGEFNPFALTFGTGHTAASAEDALRALSIFLRETGRV